MIAVALPSFETIDQAFAWLEGQGEVVRLMLYRGPDGMVRGSALVRPTEGAAK
jgi:hypothetical protein